VHSNVKYNAYLKEIGDITGIPKNKPLVTHLARKTFATNIVLIFDFTYFFNYLPLLIIIVLWIIPGVHL
jgi:hypothetical protein